MGCGEGPRRHASKHGVGPQGDISRGFLIVEKFLRSAPEHLIVTLLEHLATEDGTEINQGDKRESKDACKCDDGVSVLLEERVFHFALEFSNKLRNYVFFPNFAPFV